MFAEERQQAIYDMVCKKRSVKVTELSQLLKISEVTVRRDLEELHNQNKILRTHGGALAKYSVANEVSAPELISSHKCAEEKRKIAELAYTFVKDNDTIIADGSSTVYELIKLIAVGKRKHIKVITSSLLVMSTLAACCEVKVIMAGGEVNYRHNNLEGHITKEVIKNLRADKCFIGVNGIDEKFGYSTPRFEDAESKALMVESGIESFVLADNTKFDKTYLARINVRCNYLITDTRLAGYDYEWLLGQTKVLFADRKKR